MYRNLRRSIFVLLIVVLVILMLFGLVPGRAACALRPVAYTDYFFAVPGPFYNFDMYILAFGQKFGHSQVGGRTMVWNKV